MTQHNHSIFYKAADDPRTSEAADMLKKDDMPCASRRPRWKLSEASWPVFEGKPSLFLGQLYVPETPTTKARFGRDEAVTAVDSRSRSVSFASTLRVCWRRPTHSR